MSREHLAPPETAPETPPKTAPETAPETAGGRHRREGPTSGHPSRWWAALPAGLRYSLLVYVVTRVAVVAGTGLYLRSRPDSSVQTIAVTWDGYWYTHIAKDGYSSSLRSPVAVVGPAHHTLSDWAFFPGYPLLIRAVGWLTRTPLVPAAIVLAAVLGVLAVWAVYALGEAHGGVQVARGAALLFAAWPGTAALNLPYTEGLFLAAAAGALVCLSKQRWVAAGLLGAVASGTRPNGVAVVAAATVAALLAVARERQWRALFAPTLSAAGAGAFLLYGWQRTGDPLVWRHAENLWHQRLDFSTEVVRGTITLLADADTGMQTYAGQVALGTTVLRLLGLLLVAAMVAAAWANRRRLSLPVVVYAAVSLATIFASSHVSTRPRMVLAVLPGFVWLAAWLPRRATVVLAVCMLPILGLITYLWAWGVPP